MSARCGTGPGKGRVSSWKSRHAAGRWATRTHCRLRLQAPQPVWPMGPPLNRCRCPKNTLARKVLGGLKDRAEPVDLPVYPVRVQGGKVFVKFI